ncbi:helix-turn-helix domain-containing protein [Craterilacuibacter sp. RT1T]|uniref:helix-turn-helix domain-containing protein n=1 Tax=Craterilacuibacter sp. RT1T TaxID=2942211 RepID=UPI0020BF5414|nr:helix-turn-helix domain-containing protein [Craterilacuibacter sp. RT1T]MCL6264370.1 helix-turn-helix domain-containing protein [Craterilacuibacter sp. RT1T]
MQTLKDKYTRPEAAAYLGLSIHTLNDWACTGRYGLRFYRIGRKCVYLKSDLDAFMAARTAGTTRTEAGQ